MNTARITRAALSLAAFVLATLAWNANPSSALAQAEEGEAVPRYDRVHAFEREFAVALYGTGHAGSYLSAGVGGRLRWEFVDWLGVEAYLEGTVVDWEGGGVRHDYPNGFNVYVPIRAGDFRFRPFFGFCDIVSLVEPEQADAPRADDVLFGAHAGVGVELAVHSMASLFADLQFNGYAGHDRTVEGWTGGVGEDLEFFWNLQLNVGAQFHAGR